MKKQIFIAATFALMALSLAPQKASAGLLLEPYLGYSSGKIEESTSTDTTGTAIGARIAYTLPALFWFGVDYSMLNGKTKASGGDMDYKGSDLYLMAGVDFPILARAWLGYGVMNEMTYTAGAAELKAKGGQNLKLGVGISFLPMISLNVEMYQKQKAEMELGSSTGTADNRKDNGFIVSLSVPLDL